MRFEPALPKLALLPRPRLLEAVQGRWNRSITAMLGDLATGGMFGGAGVALLTGSMGAAAGGGELLDAASGAAGIVIGTHALLQEHVQFADLGLVVVDEQHRFGVEQRSVVQQQPDLAAAQAQRQSIPARGVKAAQILG